MYKRIRWLFLFVFAVCAFCKNAYSQQDVDFHLSSHLLVGKKILKVKRDYYDPYLWVLAQNNEVYRVNSQTLSVDDYTSKFAAYNNLQFIDITGHSQDSVFVATNSTNLIAYLSGNIKTIGASRGLADTITSIGISNGEDYFDGKNLLIGTTHGFGVYYFVKDSLTYRVYNYKSSVQIFSSTYRSSMLTNDDFDFYNPTYYPVLFFTNLGGYAYYIRHMTESGNKINTAFYNASGIESFSLYLGNFFWGNANGLYQENLSDNNIWTAAYAHFLNNIKVNKVTDILGLTSFYNIISDTVGPKDNLLIGTDNGLYFSSNTFRKFDSGLSVFSLTHFDALGNVPVNDVCVNSTSTSIYDITSGCEDGVWLAAQNGLYLLKPDFAKYFTPGQQSDILTYNNIFPQPPDSVTNVTLCSGSTMPLQILYMPQPTNANIQWVKNGRDISGQTSRNLTVQDSGEYYAIIYSSCENIHIETNHIKVNTISGPVFTFNYPDKIQYCDSSSTTLKIDNNPSYHYRWYSNGNLNGDTTSSLIVTQSGKYKVEVSACTNSWIPSKEIEVDLVNPPLPSITSDKTVYCQSDTALLSANTLIDTSYTINWYKDGTLLSADKNLSVIKATVAGNYMATITSNITSCSKSSAQFQLSLTPAPSFTFNYADVINYCAGSSQTLTAQGDPSYQYRWYTNGVLNGTTTNALTVNQTGKYKIEVSACQNSWVPSKEIQVNFQQLPQPVIKADKPAYCIGDQASLNLNIPIDPSYTINWLRDGTIVDAYQGLAAITTSIPGAYTAMITSTSVGNCNQTTSPVQITFSPPPQVSIQQIVNTTLCSGQDITLKASYSSGTVKWSTGESSDQISVKTSGKYAASVTTDAGCVVDTSITINFLPNPVLAVHDTDLCEFSRQNVTLTAPAGYSKYVWNGHEGNNTFVVNAIQTVSLTVTDANGCQATQKIIVSSNCAGVQLPNAFTPNGDGINDTWAITGLTNDPSVLIQVYNRYGTEVYKSKGYTAAWNGTYNGNKLPAGVYYYIISAKNGKQTLSGSVTIIY